MDTVLLLSIGALCGVLVTRVYLAFKKTDIKILKCNQGILVTKDDKPAHVDSWMTRTEDGEVVEIKIEGII